MKRNFKKNRHLISVVIAVVAVAGWVSIPFLNRGAAAATGVPILVRTAFLASPTGSVNPHGSAEYDVYSDGNRELEVEIEDVNLPAGTSLDAIVDGNNVGQIILLADRSGKLRLKTELGQTVPVTNDGSTVAVRNGSTVLVAGVLNGGGPNPSPSPTGSPSGSPSPSPTGSPTGSPSPSPTGSPTGSPSPSPTGSPNAGNLFASLSGSVINGVLPSGYSEFEIHSSRLELETRVFQVNLPAGTVLSVAVNGTPVGNMVLQSGGEGRQRLRTDEGATIPAVTAGSTIVISLGGTTVLSGTFGGFGPSPSPSPGGPLRQARALRLDVLLSRI